MHVVCVVPGIMGTELLLEEGGATERVWPPTPLETQFGYKRRDKLASPKAKPGRIIRNVLCFEFYAPLLDCIRDLGFAPDGAEQRVIAFPYDWRRDLFDTASALAAALDGAHAAGASQISLVAHSMGGLICRLLLEADTWKDRPWFDSIEQFIAVGTPHLGAPLALGRILGVDAALGLSGEDFAWLANNEAFPSAYQLLPAPGEAACWNQADPGLASLDIYDPEVADALGLSVTLLGRAKAVHDVLGVGNAPVGVRYFFFAATGHRTPTRVNVFRGENGIILADQTVLSRTLDSGDGTVPMFSALPRVGQRHIAVNEHASAFKGDAFRKVFVRLLGGDEGAALEDLTARLALSIEAPIVTSGQSIEVLLYTQAGAEDPQGVFGAISGHLVLRKMKDGSASEEVRREPLEYSGPLINRLRFYLAPLLEPAHYQLTFESPQGNAGPEAFGICAKLANATGRGR